MHCTAHTDPYILEKLLRLYVYLRAFPSTSHMYGDGLDNTVNACMEWSISVCAVRLNITSAAS